MGEYSSKYGKYVQTAKKALYSGLAALVLGTAAACHKNSPTSPIPSSNSSPTIYAYSGTVLNDNGTPASGAKVYLAPGTTAVQNQVPNASFPSTITGPNGNWVIRLYADGTRALGIGNSTQMAIIDKDNNGVGDDRSYNITNGQPVTDVVAANTVADGSWLDVKLSPTVYASGETMSPEFIGYNYGASPVIVNFDVIQSKGGLETILGTIGPVTMQPGATDVVVNSVVDPSWPTTDSQPGSSYHIDSAYGKSDVFVIHNALTPVPTYTATQTYTPTATTVPPTSTPVPPSNTPTPTDTPTAVPTNTSTSVPPTNTFTSTYTSVPSNTPTSIPPTSTATLTSIVTDTFTPTQTPVPATSTPTPYSISHVPILDDLTTKDIPVTIDSSSTGPLSATLFYKVSTNGTWLSQPMTQINATQYAGALPDADIPEDAVDMNYYIEATDGSVIQSAGTSLSPNTTRIHLTELLMDNTVASVLSSLGTAGNWNVDSSQLLDVPTWCDFYITHKNSNTIYPEAAINCQSDADGINSNDAPSTWQSDNPSHPTLNISDRTKIPDIQTQTTTFWNGL